MFSIVGDISISKIPFLHCILYKMGGNDHTLYVEEEKTIDGVRKLFVLSPFTHLD